jgi:hypothetical protein
MLACLPSFLEVKVELKFTLELAMKAQSGRRGSAVLFEYSLCVRLGCLVLYFFERDPVPSVSDAGWAP